MELFTPRSIEGLRAYSRDVRVLRERAEDSPGAVVGRDTHSFEHEAISAINRGYGQFVKEQRPNFTFTATIVKVLDEVKGDPVARIRHKQGSLVQQSKDIALWRLACHAQLGKLATLTAGDKKVRVDAHADVLLDVRVTGSELIGYVPDGATGLERDMCSELFRVDATSEEYSLLANIDPTEFDADSTWRQAIDAGADTGLMLTICNALDGLRVEVR